MVAIIGRLTGNKLVLHRFVSALSLHYELTIETVAYGIRSSLDCCDPTDSRQSPDNIVSHGVLKSDVT